MHILIVDDDPLHSRVLESLLAPSGDTLLKASNGAEALKHLETAHPIGLVIADWMMPEMDGLQLCREVRRRVADRYIYYILLTSRDHRDDLVAGLDAGADDYLVKPVHASEFHARIRAARRILDLQEKLLAVQETLRVLALHDALTGLLNRRAIFESLGRELDRSRRQGTPLAVVLLDIDHFKRVNDTQGHLVGDEVLREAGRRMRRTVRSYDSVGRYGGEEFLVVAPGFDGTRALDLAERIRLQFAQDPFPIPGGSLPVTASLGVVALDVGCAPETGAVLAAADEALYRAKHEGRNRTVFGTLPPVA